MAYTRLSVRERFTDGTRYTVSTMLSYDGTPCWIWNGCRHIKTGYALIRCTGKTRTAHRVSYEIHIGPIPRGLQIDHLCRRRDCVNPAHLEAVTQLENVRRGLGGSKNREKTTCKHGHLFSTNNTRYQKVGPYVMRVCRECHAIYSRKWKDEQKLKRTKGLKPICQN